MVGEVKHETMDSEKQSEGFEGAGGGRLGEPGGGIREGTNCTEHWVWCKNKEYCYAENKNLKKTEKLKKT